MFVRDLEAGRSIFLRGYERAWALKNCTLVTCILLVHPCSLLILVATMLHVSR